MVEPEEALVQLRDACPSFRPPPSPSGADPAHYAAMAELSALAHHLVELAAAGDADELPGVFAVVDRLITEGDAQTVTLVRTHLLEDLQNITSHRDVSVAPGAIRSVLGPAAAVVWDELDDSWWAAMAAAPTDRPRADDYLDLGPTERRELQAMTRELPDGTLARPSDVLRYESERYDEQLEARSARRQRYPLTLLLVAVLVLAVVVIAVS